MTVGIVVAIATLAIQHILLDHFLVDRVFAPSAIDAMHGDRSEGATDTAGRTTASALVTQSLHRLLLLSNLAVVSVFTAMGLGVVLVALHGLEHRHGKLVHAMRRMAEGDLTTPVDSGLKKSRDADLLAALEGVRQQLQAALEERHRQAYLDQLILSNAGDGIFGIDHTGTCTFVNPATSRMLGWTPEALIGRRIHEIIHGQMGAGLGHTLAQCPITRAHVERSIQTVANDSFRRRDGGWFPVEYTATPIIEDDTAIGAVVVFRDRTGERELQAQLIQSSKLATLGEMATSVAHELNQPLNVIRLATENIRRKAERGTIDPDILKEKIETIYGNIQRASAIINHMRVFGRKAGTTRGPVDLRSLVDGMMNLIGQQLRLLLIEVAVRIEDGLPPAHCNAIQLEQVLLNLVHNARDALMTKDINHPRVIEIIGEIDRADSKMLRLSVRDTGGGIDEKSLDRVFEPFFTTKEIGEGTGLGLSISYGIISEMNGHLGVENTDDGALFSIRLPISTEGQKESTRPGAIGGRDPF